MHEDFRLVLEAGKQSATTYRPADGDPDTG